MSDSITALQRTFGLHEDPFMGAFVDRARQASVGGCRAAGDGRQDIEPRGSIVHCEVKASIGTNPKSIK